MNFESRRKFRNVNFYIVYNMRDEKKRTPETYQQIYYFERHATTRVENFLHRRRTATIIYIYITRSNKNLINI